MSTVGAHGHVNPNLPVMTELVTRGHRVSYTCPERFAPAVASSGATPLVVASDVPDESRGEQWPDAGVPAMQIFLDEARGVYPQLLDALDGDRPDAVLYDGSGWAGQALARAHGLPGLALYPHIVAWDGYEEDMAGAWSFLDEPDGVAWRRAFDDWLDDVGAGVGSHAFLNHPARCAVLIPEAMQPHADRVDREIYTYVGPVLDERPHQESWPEPARPLLLVTLGSNYTDRPEFFRDVVAAVREPGWEAVVAIGTHVDPDALGPLPAHVTVRPWVPQLAVLARASAFVTHAGMGGCAEALFHGVPMVAVPQAVDQFGNAEQLVALGVGERIATGDVTPELLRAAVDRVASSPDVAAACAEQRALARAAGGARAAADLAESLL
jgi:MGT family glycosyltransferase